MKRLLLFGLMASVGATAQISKTARLDSVHTVRYYNQNPYVTERVLYAYDEAANKNSFKDFSINENYTYDLEHSATRQFNANHLLLEQMFYQQ